jgi:photosystem II stability/assembly factor-like uncharacterized protein
MMIRSFLLLLLLAVALDTYSQGTWQTLPSVPPYGRFDDMYFINDSTGFIAQESMVFKTSDRGSSWNLISFLDSNYSYVRSIEFINDSVGFAGLLYSSSPLSGNLFKTTNGGHSWTLLQNMQIQPHDGICGMAHLGNTLIAVGTFAGPAWFYRSDDLGLTWKKVDLSAFASGLVDCFMINSSTILVSGIADSAYKQKATILRSEDGGETWIRVYLAPNPTSYCWKMFIRPNGVGIASVEFGKPIIARTTNFGTSWQTEHVYSSPSSDLGGIGLLNDTLGWVMDQHDFGTWETHDGGLTWGSVNSPVKSGDRMVILDSVTALVAGGSVYRYQYGVVTSSSPFPTSAYKKIHELTISPNPSNDKINIDAMAGTNTFGLLDILNAGGSIVQHITRQPFKKGNNFFTVDIKNLADGNYQLLWRTNELFLTKSFEVIH